MADFTISAGGSKVSIHGVDALISALSGVGEDVSHMPDVWHEAGEVVADKARQIVPVLTGALRASIYAGYGDDKAVIWAGQNLHYAGRVHFGDPVPGIEGQPFLTEALDLTAETVVDTVEDALADLLVRRL